MTVKLHGDERIDQLMRYNLQIIQSKSVFSFSIDALLLDYFSNIPSHGRATIVDLCSGNGILPLALSQRSKSSIIGMELQPRLVDMAKRSLELNDLSRQVEIIEADLADAFNYIPKDSVDVITCNPPYFEWSETSQKNPNEHLAIARHEIHTTLEEVIRIASGLLKMNGRAFFVYRPSRLIEMLDLFRSYQLMPKKLQFIYPKKNCESNMILVEVIKHGKKSGLKILPPLYIHDENGEYLPEIKEIIYG
ncbi:MAG: tRNA1(Val) (adenine(37)-N6)-methyltransferase [Atopococcus tabaci]|uniref:tRNA1(Val) (Adenine(37)-N6)-methyltransferase n=1 Tax=Atopococcus tabaci TaxID=269774 RepID=A0AA43UCL3_9LACT|nr:tRNA1(Val) (adenine(37)-N6)-methyltransferase [Atopococcus tabaci]